MIKIQRLTLDNGLRVIVHEDHTTPMAAFNVAYDVGSRDENPDHTGFAHLMEPGPDELLHPVAGQQSGDGLLGGIGPDAAAGFPAGVA